MDGSGTDRGPWTRGRLARATGCNAETVRYYEKIGLLPAPDRSAAGYRLYERAHLRRLTFVMRARALGFSLADIRALLHLGEGGAASCAEVKARTEAHLTDVRDRIADLRRIEVALAETAAKCAGSDLPDCPVMDALSGGAQAE